MSIVKLGSGKVAAVISGPAGRQSQYRQAWFEEDAEQQLLKREIRALACAAAVAVDERNDQLHGANAALASKLRERRKRLTASIQTSLMYAALENQDPTEVLLFGAEDYAGVFHRQRFERLAEMVSRVGYEAVPSIKEAARQIIDQARKACDERRDGSEDAVRFVASAAIDALIDTAIMRADLFSRLEPLVTAVTGINLEDDDEPHLVTPAAAKPDEEDDAQN